MEKHFELSDAEFEEKFESCELDPSIFSHEAHIRLAWIHITKYGLAQAKLNIQNQLLKFVSHVGARDKYHMTLTIVAIQAVSHFVKKSEVRTFEAFIMEFPQLNTDFKTLINSHYSYNIFKSIKARSQFMAPDLIPFEE